MKCICIESLGEEVSICLLGSPSVDDPTGLAWKQAEFALLAFDKGLRLCQDRTQAELTAARIEVDDQQCKNWLKTVAAMCDMEKHLNCIDIIKKCK